MSGPERQPSEKLPSLSRRNAMALTVAGMASPAFAQEADGKANCYSSETFGSWRAVSHRYFIPPNAMKTTVDLGTEQRDFTQTIENTEGDVTLRWQGFPYAFQASDKPKVRFFARPDGYGMHVTLGKPEVDQIEDALNAARQSPGLVATLHADTTEIARYDGINERYLNVPIQKDALSVIATQTKTLTVRFYVGEVGRDNMAIRLRIPFAGLPEAMAALPGLYQAHLAEVSKATQGCKPVAAGCAMTTAAVGLLGRADDCFELTQMRRLRAAFPDYDWVIRDYLQASAEILARPGPRLTTSLLAFYALIVWPTALFVAAGIRKPAGYLYLGGFALLKRAMGVKPSGLPLAANTSGEPEGRGQSPLTPR